MSQFNFSIEHIKCKTIVIANILSRCEYEKTEISTSAYHSPSSPAYTTISLLPLSPPNFTHSPNTSSTNPTNTMPAIRIHKEALTPSPSRRRSVSHLPSLAEMYQRSSITPPQAVCFANVQTRAQAQRGRSVTRKPNFRILIDNSNRYLSFNQLSPGQTSPGRSYSL